MLVASSLIEQDNLGVIPICAVDRQPISTIAACESQRVHINKLGVTLFTEYQALLRGSARAEVRRVIGEVDELRIAIFITKEFIF